MNKWGLIVMAEAKYVRNGRIDEKNSASYAQPRLFDLRHYHGSFTEPFTVHGLKHSASITNDNSETYSKQPVSRAKAQDASQGEQQFLYLEFAPTEEHLRKAYDSNVRHDNNPMVRKSLDAANAARTAIERGDYTTLVDSLEHYRKIRSRHLSETTEPITAADFKGAMHYTNPSFVQKLSETYGFETPSVGLVIPPSKWRYAEVAQEHKTPAKTAPKQGLAQKLNCSTQAAGVNISAPEPAFGKTPYKRTGLSLIERDGQTKSGEKHESLHAVYALYSKEYGPRKYKGVDELNYTPAAERFIVTELSSFRTQAKDWKDADWSKRKIALKHYPDKYTKEFFASGLKFSNGGEERLDRALQLVESRIDAAADAVKHMQDAGVPESEITRRLLTAGSTKDEAERGEYHSPLEDVIAWGKYTEKEVKKGKYKPKEDP